MNSSKHKHNVTNGVVKGYCLPCKKKVRLHENIKLVKRKLPNGRTVFILCGRCKGCEVETCTIIANS